MTSAARVVSSLSSWALKVVAVEKEKIAGCEGRGHWNGKVGKKPNRAWSAFLWLLGLMVVSCWFLPLMLLLKSKIRKPPHATIDNKRNSFYISTLISVVITFWWFIRASIFIFVVFIQTFLLLYLLPSCSLIICGKVSHVQFAKKALNHVPIGQGKRNKKTKMLCQF